MVGNPRVPPSPAPSTSLFLSENREASKVPRTPGWTERARLDGSEEGRQEIRRVVRSEPGWKVSMRMEGRSCGLPRDGPAALRGYRTCQWARHRKWC